MKAQLTTTGAKENPDQTSTANPSPPVARKAGPGSDSTGAGPAQRTKGRLETARADQAATVDAPSEAGRKSLSAGGQKEIQFRFDAPAAREVLLAAEFTNWDKAPIKLIKGGGGVWHTKLSLAPGRHLYRFLVDGEWRDDPSCPGRVPNPFGTANSVVEIS